MNVISTRPIAGDINAIREHYDTDNPVIAEILKAKEERLKILQELNKQHQEEFDNKELLLKNDFKPEKSKVKKSRKSESSLTDVSLRRSTRLQNSSTIEYRKFQSTGSESVKSDFVRPPNDYGPIPGVEVGFHWETRMECSMYGVHRPTVAGIHAGPEGAYSIALSGGYPEDVDDGYSFLYTGAGGRDLKGTATKPKNLRTAPQTKDQQLEGTNLSLVKSIESKLPVRVIRGYKSTSIFAPETGYRYDGLYQVVEYWEDVGKTGYRVYRFRMERMKNQAPAPWDSNSVTTQVGRRALKKREEDAEDELEFKENVAPAENSSANTNPDVEDSVGEVDVDEEIEMCINFFCKASAVSSRENLKEDCNEEEFLGWDEK